MFSPFRKNKVVIKDETTPCTAGEAIKAYPALASVSIISGLTTSGLMFSSSLSDISFVKLCQVASATASPPIHETTTFQKK